MVMLGIQRYRDIGLVITAECSKICKRVVDKGETGRERLILTELLISTENILCRVLGMSNLLCEKDSKEILDSGNGIHKDLES